VHTIRSLDESDRRSIEMKVAGPAALLVAKLHKLGERQDQSDRLIDKDAHDLYRLLVATDTHKLAATIAELQRDELAGKATTHAIEYLRVLFADGPDALGAVMAGRAEQLVGEPVVVSAASAVLAADLLAALDTGR
jgi:hypothetical protein